MKVSIVTQSLGIKSGGPSRSVVALFKGLLEKGVDIDILTTNIDRNPNIIQADRILSVNSNNSGLFGFVPGVCKLLRQSKSQLFHIQGLFSYIPTIAPLIARSKHIPYIIAPRGMMYKNALQKSKMKKYIFRKLFLDYYINKANCIQATCKEELEELRDAGIKVPIAIIPNSIIIPNELPTSPLPDKFRVVFVGRINEIKNIDGLIQAWALAGIGNDINSELLIIGGANLDTEKKYLIELRKIEKELGITNIKWEGMVTGREKDILLQTSSLAILPSHSENFGMVVPEALINGVPVIASDKTPWKILEEYNCGWSTSNDPESMARIIMKAKDISPQYLKQMGINGQKFVIDNFASDKVTDKLIRMYNWVLGKESQPDYVYK